SVDGVEQPLQQAPGAVSLSPYSITINFLLQDPVSDGEHSFSVLFASKDGTTYSYQWTYGESATSAGSDGAATSTPNENAEAHSGVEEVPLDGEWIEQSGWGTPSHVADVAAATDADPGEAVSFTPKGEYRHDFPIGMWFDARYEVEYGVWFDDTPPPGISYGIIRYSDMAAHTGDEDGTETYPPSDDVKADYFSVERSGSDLFLLLWGYYGGEGAYDCFRRL
ncbi:MAG: hypothetical protein MUD05_10495, partial [Candidatus Nanopelagicales bacterium]|nr:hypothetical protein [Candidatus Nanopelagicales bacterium]